VDQIDQKLKNIIVVLRASYIILLFSDIYLTVCVVSFT